LALPPLVNSASAEPNFLQQRGIKMTQSLLNYCKTDQRDDERLVTIGALGEFGVQLG